MMRDLVRLVVGVAMVATVCCGIHGFTGFILVMAGITLIFTALLD